MVLSDMQLNVPRSCGCQTGIIYVRRCGRPAPFECGQCGLYLCDGHASHSGDNPGDILCPDCQASLGGQGSAAFTGRRDSQASFGAYSDGIGSDWADDGPAFAEEDYAAFDALSEFDANADDGHAYDS